MRNTIIKQAKEWLGKNEADGSHKQIINIYNAHKPLARGYKVKYTDNWCATFASALAIKCGLTSIIPTECSCIQLIDKYKAMGRWQEKDSYVPKTADFIFYDWEDSGKGDNLGSPNHIGIVEAVKDNTITVIEGNKNNRVERRELAINGKYIRGFATPDYKVKGGSVKVDNTPDKYAKEAVDWAIKNKIIVGNDVGDLKLHSTVTRQDLLVMLFRAIGK